MRKKSLPLIEIEDLVVSRILEVCQSIAHYRKMFKQNGDGLTAVMSGCGEELSALHHILMAIIFHKSKPADDNLRKVIRQIFKMPTHFPNIEMGELESRPYLPIFAFKDLPKFQKRLEELMGE
jgi:hypothetical protein